MVNKRRLILPGFLSHDVCKELEFIHKSCSTVGYRPHVFSTTLAHLIATNCASLIMPFIPIRDRLKETIEDFFGCQLELFVEFTGLISWTKGASIGWHSDDNRPYLKQRHYAAVCYLNNYNEDFKGGLFHFQEGELTTIVPKIGDAILYTADEINVHCVDEITEGERCTLTLWFTYDSSHNEDIKLINQLFDRVYPYYKPNRVNDYNSDSPMSHMGKEEMVLDSYSKNIEELSDCNSITNLNVSRNLHFSSDLISEYWIPFPASSNMYWVNEDHITREEAYDYLVDAEEKYLDFDIRWARLSLLGFEFCFDESSGNSNDCETRMQQTNDDCTSYSPDALDKPLRLKRKGIVLPELFSNSLHALQVVLFYHWKIRKQSNHIVEGAYSYVSGAATAIGASTCHTQLQKQNYNSLRKLLFEKFRIQDSVPAEFNVKYSSSSSESQHGFDFEDFTRATDDWKHYLYTLWKSLLVSFAQWESNQMIFPV